MKCLLLAFLLTLCFAKSKYFDDQRTNIHNYFQNESGRFLLDSLSANNVRTELKVSDERRGRICLKNVTTCMEKDSSYRTTTDKLSRFLFSSFPPLDLSQFDGISEKCRRQSKKYIEDLKKFKLWALKMYDSNAKLPSGILNGNLNQFGDFDMCLEAYSKIDNIEGQYCLASMEIQTPQSSYLAGIHQLIQSYYHFSSKLTDPGHRVPRFSVVNWALCLPSVCTVEDVEYGFSNTVNSMLQDTGIQIRYKVEKDMCQTRNLVVPFSTYLVIGIFAATIFWEFIATFYEYWAVGEKNKWITAFSFKKNLESLTSTERSSNDIESVHGIRCLNAVLLLLSHKSMALFFQPYVNRTEFVEFISRPFSVLGRAASLYTDPFIMISGTLTTFSFLGKLNRNQKINILEEYISRLFRIVPTLVALIAFCTFVLPWMDNGPLWNQVVTHHSDICKRYWWRNLLFIHNYFGFQDMCLTHTHHIGIDTQLFFISPFLVYMLWKWPKKGAMILVALATISTVMRYYVTYTLRLNNYVHFGTSIQQLFDTADNMYILPLHRLTVYVIGIFLGYVLRNAGNIRLTKVQLKFGNALAIASFCISYFGAAFMGSIDYIYEPLDAAFYASVSPILWCFSFAWLIFTSQLGYANFLGKFFSAKGFSLWTKISYTVYLTQFPVFFYNVGTTRSATNYGFFHTILNFKEYIWVCGLSVALTLTFELPFQNIREILIKCKHKPDSKSLEISRKMS